MVATCRPDDVSLLVESSCCQINDFDCMALVHLFLLKLASRFLIRLLERMSNVVNAEEQEQVEEEDCDARRLVLSLEVLLIEDREQRLAQN